MLIIHIFNGHNNSHHSLPQFWLITNISEENECNIRRDTSILKIASLHLCTQDKPFYREKSSNTPAEMLESSTSSINIF